MPKCEGLFTPQDIQCTDPCLLKGGRQHLCSTMTLASQCHDMNLVLDLLLKCCCARSGVGRCKCLAPVRVPEQRGLPAATETATQPAKQPESLQAADEIILPGDPFALSVSPTGQQRSSELSTGADNAIAEATAASLRSAASEEGQREAVWGATATAVDALHGFTAALLARLEVAAMEAAEAAQSADAQPGIADIVVAANVPQEAPLLRECVSFKLSGMSQTTRSGTEAPVPPLGMPLSEVERSRRGVLEGSSEVSALLMH